MDTYIATYKKDGYTLADHFRPHPGWGTRTFTCPKDKMPPHTDAEMVEGARATAPDGYWLSRLELREEKGTRTIYHAFTPGRWDDSIPLRQQRPVDSEFYAAQQGTSQECQNA